MPVPGEPNRFTFDCGGPDLSGKVTLGWTMLYAVKVAAIILTTRFATGSLLSVVSMAVRSAIRLEKNLRRRKARRGRCLVPSVKTVRVSFGDMVNPLDFPLSQRGGLT